RPEVSPIPGFGKTSPRHYGSRNAATASPPSDTETWIGATSVRSGIDTSYVPGERRETLDDPSAAVGCGRFMKPAKSLPGKGTTAGADSWIPGTGLPAALETCTRISPPKDACRMTAGSSALPEAVTLAARAGAHPGAIAVTSIAPEEGAVATKSPFTS